MYSILWLFCYTDTNTPRPLQHQWNWWQPPLPIARRTSRSNGGAPDLAHAKYDASILPPSHLVFPVLPSHPVSSKPIFSHSTSQRIKSHFLRRKLEWTNTIQHLLWRWHQQDYHTTNGEYNPSKSSPRCPNLSEITWIIRKNHHQLPHLLICLSCLSCLSCLICLRIQILFHIYCSCPLIWFSPSPDTSATRIWPLPSMLHLMMSALYWPDISPSPRQIDWSFTKKPP